MSVGFYLVTFPVQIGAIVVDIPFGLIEFFVGWPLFKDELLGWQDLQDLPRIERDAKGNVWTLSAHTHDNDSLLLTQERNGIYINAYQISRLDRVALKIRQIPCESSKKSDPCS